MWKIKRIKAKNICSFETLELEPVQGQATLIFGRNMDSDSQNSNGSGKSALIECIAVGLTGDPLRKVGQDEIINDNYDEARVTIELLNHESGSAMVIDRTFRRRKPQEVHVATYNDSDGAIDVAQSSVNDYNAFIMDQLGITRDDLYSNYILTARRYKSFLSSSDSDKKALINRLSNANLIDEAVKDVKEDLDASLKLLAEKDKAVAERVGSINALSHEIELQKRADERAEDERVTKLDMVRQQIEDDTNELDFLKSKVQGSEVILRAYEDCRNEIGDISLKFDIPDYVRTINDAFKAIGHSSDNLLDVGTYLQQYEEYKDRIKGLARDLLILEGAKVKAEEGLRRAQQLLDDNNESYTKVTGEADMTLGGLYAEKNDLTIKLTECLNRRSPFFQELTKVESAIRNCQVRSAGMIECPQCHHHFSTTEDTPEKVQADMEYWTDQHVRLKNDLEAMNAEIACYEARIKEITQQCAAWEKKKEDVIYFVTNSYNRVKQCTEDVNKHVRDAERLKNEMERSEAMADGVKSGIYNSACSIIDTEIARIENVIGTDQRFIKNFEATLSKLSYEAEALSKPVDTSRVEDMENRLLINKELLIEAERQREDVQTAVDMFKAQIALFEEFKTYVANTKVGAISKITNDFLEAIGSDIRLSLSGYTVLKNGKVRDKISASLTRDGKDCGSYDKFSAGERCRVELACILAMHSLINQSAKGGGLDILVLDEILDASDETGLASVFKALNDTGVTSLVISHGNISEGYRNRLTVYKENGVSHL